MLVRVRRTIEEATSTAEAVFRWEWAALESERQHLGDWHIHLEERTKAEASRAAAARSELEADQESYRKGLRKVFDREVAVVSREKALALWEEAIAKEEASLGLSGPSSSLAARDSRSASWSSTSSSSLFTNGARSYRRPPASRPLPR